MAFTTFGSFQEIAGNKRRSVPPTITTAAFGTLTALGQIPLVGIVYNAGTAYYNVLVNGATVATNQTASSYTYSGGLSNNTQYGPFTVVPYTASGVAGTAFTVTGGTAGSLYTLGAVTSSVTFNATTSGGTTLSCSGAYSSVVITYSPTGGTPASGAAVSGANTTSQAYTGLTSGTSYTFNVYAVNGGGVQNGTPVTGTVSTGAVGPPVWYASGTGNYPLSYSTNAINWTVQNFAGCNTVGGSFQSCAYNGTVAVGSIYNGNIRYSSNFTNWTATNTSSATIGIVNISTAAYGNGVFVFCGNATTSNQFVYSSDGITWTVQALKPAYNGAYFPQSVSFHPYLNIFISGAFNGGFTYSTNGIHWTAVTGASTSATMASSSTSSTIVASWGTNTLRYSINGGQTFTLCPSLPTGFNSTNSITGISYVNGRFFASSNVGTTTAGYYSIAYSVDGVNWTGLVLGTTVNPGTTQFGYTPNAGGVYTAMGTSNLYSTDGMNWTSCIAGGTNSYFSIATNLPPPPPMWLSCSGLSGKSLAYSTNAVNWTAFAAGGGIDAQGGMDTLQYNGSIWVGKTGNGTLQYCSNSNGTNWTFATTGSTSTFNGTNTPTWLAYGKGCWVCGGASGNGNTLAYSANGVTWTGLGKLVPFNANSNSVIFNAYLGVFMTTGNGGANTYGYSSNGIHWTGFSTAGVLKIVASSTTNMIVASINNTLSYTTGGLGSAFTTCPSLPTGFSNNSITGLGFANNLFFAGCQNGFTYTLAYSANGINWTGVVLSTLTNNLSYTYAFNYSPLGKVYNAAGQGGNCMLYSTDAINWTTIILVGNSFNATAYFVVSNS